MAFTSLSSSSSDNEVASYSKACAKSYVTLQSHYDNDEIFSSDFDESMPTSPVYDRYNSGEEYHAVPPSYTGTFMPLKPDLVFHDAFTVNDSVPTAFNVEPSPTKPNMDLSQSNKPSTSIIEDWVSDSEDESEDLLQLPNKGKQEKERRTCGDYLKYKESRVRIKCESISKKKKSNDSSFQDMRSSCNEDM
nr:hypothetical protein [Tanacetum cinerariifolium]